MQSEATKSVQAIDQLILLRLVVGYLGQRKQAGWWDCGFLDATGFRFLENTFPRTAWAAALRSTTEAACIVHDRAIGRVGNYHLFRLPPAVEDRLERAIANVDWTESAPQVASRDTALEVLRRLADTLVKAPPGPVQVGVEPRILTSTAMRELAAHYHSAFQDEIRCFPYFTPVKDER